MFEKIHIFVGDFCYHLAEYFISLSQFNLLLKIHIINNFTEYQLFFNYPKTMMKLSSYKHKFLTENNLRALTQNQILTVVDFLMANVEKLTVITKLSLSQVVELRKDIYEKYCAPLLNGADLFLGHIQTKKTISTGISNLDCILDGGIPVGYITELCGLAGTGKSQMCMQLSINVVKNSNNSVLYINTKGDFSAIRIQKILQLSGIPLKDMAMVMCRIKLVYIWNMRDLTELMKKLAGGKMVVENLSLIIVDSLPCLMFQHFGDDNKIGYTLLNTFVNESRDLCKQMLISIICVNVQTRWVEEEMLNDRNNDVRSKNFIERRNRCLGKYWQHIPALVIILEKKQYTEIPKTNDKVIDVTVFKNNITQISKKCSLINNITGIS